MIQHRFTGWNITDWSLVQVASFRIEPDAPETLADFFDSIGYLTKKPPILGYWYFQYRQNDQVDCKDSLARKPDR